MIQKDSDRSSSSRRARASARDGGDEGTKTYRRTALLGVALGAVLALVMLPGARPALAGGAPCTRTSFKTVLVKEACAKGQKSAKKAMKDWVKKAKKNKAGLECATCHTDMAPGYELKPDGLKLFKELGGK